jgi:hypothetical protein
LANGWGGRRRNQGRPLGSKNRIPRSERRPVAETERLRRIVAEIEDADYLVSSNDKEFKGSSFEFLKAMMRAERLPIKVRLYAAKEIVGYEPRLAEGELLDAVFNSSVIMDELQTNSAERTRERDAKLRQWIEEGRVTEAAVILIRGLFVNEHDPVWVPMPQPEPAAPEDTRQITYFEKHPDNFQNNDEHSAEVVDNIAAPEESNNSNNTDDNINETTTAPSPWALPPLPAPTLILFAEPRRARSAARTRPTPRT